MRFTFFVPTLNGSPIFLPFAATPSQKANYPTTIRQLYCTMNGRRFRTFAINFIERSPANSNSKFRLMNSNFAASSALLIGSVSFQFFTVHWSGARPSNINRRKLASNMFSMTKMLFKSLKRSRRPRQRNENENVFFLLSHEYPIQRHTFIDTSLLCNSL